MDFFYTRLLKGLITPTSGAMVLASSTDEIHSIYNVPIDIQGFADLSLPDINAYIEACVHCKIDTPKSNLLPYDFDRVFSCIKDGFGEELEVNLLILTGEQRSNYLTFIVGMNELSVHYDRYGYLMDYFSSKINEINSIKYPIEFQKYQESFLLAFHSRQFLTVLDEGVTFIQTYVTVDNNQTSIADTNLMEKKVIQSEETFDSLFNDEEMKNHVHNLMIELKLMNSRGESLINQRDKSKLLAFAHALKAKGMINEKSDRLYSKIFANKIGLSYTKLKKDSWIYDDFNKRVTSRLNQK